MADKPQSRFWAGPDSSEVESEASISDSEEEVQAKPDDRKNQWKLEESDSESQDDGQRVVKSAKHKADDDFQKAFKEIKNAININDWNNITTLFQKLSTLLLKHATVTQGAKSGSIDNYPDYYFHSLKIIQKAIDDLSNDKPAQKKLSKTNGKSFNSLRARFKKVVTEEYEKKMSALTDVKDLKDGSDESQSSEDESDSSSSSSSSDDSGSDSGESASESEEDVKKSKAKPKNKFAVQSSGSDSGFEDDDVDKLQGENDSTSDDSEWDTDSVSSSSSDEDAETSNLTGRAKWLKRTTVVDKSQQKEEKKLKEQDKQERAKARKIQKEVDHEKKETAKSRQQDEELTLEKLEEQIANIVANRGRKNVDRVQLIDQMRKLTSDAHEFGDNVRIITLMHLVSLEFDIKTGLDEYMPIDLWKSAMRNVQEIVSLLNKHPDYRLRPMRGDEMESLMAKATNKLSEKQQRKMKTPEQTEDENPNEIAVVGDLSMFVDRLDNEYEKSLRYMDNHSDEYIERLKDEGDVNELAKTVFEFFLRIGNKQKAASQALLTLENNYYKHKTVALQVYHAQLVNKLRSQRESGDNDIDGESKTDSDDIDIPIEEVAKTFDLENDVLKACNFIFENGTEEMTCKAMLCQIYHYAIHDNFFKARDLLLMSRLQDSIYSYDVESQILFNRAIVQLGICAFRVGKIKECHSCLIEICQQGNKTKELLAQGVYWRRQAFGLDAKALEAQQRAERRRVLPYHKHINLDMLEFFHLCSAMLLEIPNMAAYNNNTGNTTANMQPYIISRTFRRHLEQYSRQVFTGPPENTRDHVLAAAMYLKEGEWKKCADLLLNLQLWKLQPSAEITKKILVQKIKEESLRTYMLTYSSTYQSLSADHLCQLFELSVREVHQLISKMIINDELKASWDQTSNSLILHKNEPTHLQALALNYAEKLSKLVENNESKLNTGGKAGFDKTGDQEKDGDNGSFNLKRNFIKGGRGQSKKQNAF